MTPWDEVGDGCFRRRYRSLDLDVGVVRGSDGLLVVDTRSHGGEADELLRELRMLGGPVRAVVNTHWHYDHLFGNGTFRVQAAHPEADRVVVLPDAAIYGHPRVPLLLDRFGERVREFLIAAAAQGDPDAAKQYEAVQLTPPDRLVADRAVVDLGDRSAELRHLGRGHTDSDLVVLVPDAGVAFAGDLVEESGPPAFGDDSFPLDWAGTLELLLDLLEPAAAVVPGHGDVVDPIFVRDQAGEIREVGELIGLLHAAGVAAADALAEGGRDWALPAQSLEQAVHRGYAQLDGALE